MFSFQKLEVWKESIELFQLIKVILNDNKLKKEYGVKDHLKRAVLSISNNIAEGSGRMRTQEKKHFLNIARGSVFEVVNLIFILRQDKLISKDKYLEIYKKCDKISGMLFCMIKSKKYKGL